MIFGPARNPVGAVDILKTRVHMARHDDPDHPFGTRTPGLTRPRTHASGHGAFGCILDPATTSPSSARNGNKPVGSIV